MGYPNHQEEARRMTPDALNGAEPGTHPASPRRERG
jgi:hypothetical protein